MARQPRQERIGFYGKFQPTGVDQSGARRMQALAGLAEQVGGMAEQFGIAKAEELAPAQAAQAVEEAITIDSETGKKVFGAVPTKKGYGSDLFNQEVISAYESGLSADVSEDLLKISIEANTTQEFDTRVKALTDGVQGYVNIPDTVKASFASKVNGYRTDIIKQETENQLQIAETNREQDKTIQSDDALRFIKNNNLIAAETSKSNLYELIDSRIGIDYDQQGAEILKNDFELTYQIDVNRAKLKNVFDEKGYLAAIDFIDNQINNAPAEYTSEEIESYESVLMNDLKTERVRIDLRETEISNNRSEIQTGNATNALIGLANGTMTGSDITSNAQRNAYTFSQAQTLFNIANNRGAGIDNPNVIQNVITNLYTNPEESENIIANAMESGSITSNTALNLLTTISKNKGQQNVLTTPLVKTYSNLINKAVITRRDAYSQALDPEQASREAQMQTVFAERILDEGADQAPRIANDLINANVIPSASNIPEYWENDLTTSIENIKKLIVLPKGVTENNPNGYNSVKVLEGQRAYAREKQKLQDYNESKIAYEVFKSDYNEFTKGQ